MAPAGWALALCWAGASQSFLLNERAPWASPTPRLTLRGPSGDREGLCGPGGQSPAVGGCPARPRRPPQCPSLSCPSFLTKACAAAVLSATCHDTPLQPRPHPAPTAPAGALHPSHCLPESGLGLLLVESGMMSLPEGGGGVGTTPADQPASLPARQRPPHAAAAAGLAGPGVPAAPAPGPPSGPCPAAGGDLPASFLSDAGL